MWLAIVLATSLTVPLLSKADREAACAIAHSILQEADGNRAQAEQIARARGYSRRAITLAKRYCK